MTWTGLFCPCAVLLLDLFSHSIHVQGVYCANAPSQGHTSGQLQPLLHRPSAGSTGLPPVGATRRSAVAFSWPASCLVSPVGRVDNHRRKPCWERGCSPFETCRLSQQTFHLMDEAAFDTNTQPFLRDGWATQDNLTSGDPKDTAQENTPD